MANFHPSDNELLEFSAGNLDWAVSICVAAHLQFCPHCKNKIAQFNRIGGSLLDNVEPAEVEISSFSNLMKRIKSAKPEPKLDEPKVNQELNSARAKSLPSVVQKLIPRDKALKWSFVSPALRAAHLETGQDKYEVCFHKIKRGGKVASHDHRGTEITLVLEGSFSDSEGNYSAGDYIVKKPGETHRPMAAQDQDCLCLSVSEAPVRVTGLVGHLVNPFLTIDPR